MIRLVLYIFTPMSIAFGMFMVYNILTSKKNKQIMIEKSKRYY